MFKFLIKNNLSTLARLMSDIQHVLHEQKAKKGMSQYLRLLQVLQEERQNLSSYKTCVLRQLSPFQTLGRGTGIHSTAAPLSAEL